MGDEFVEIWYKCQQQNQESFFARIRKPTNKDLRWTSIWMLITLISITMWIIATFLLWHIVQILLVLTTIISSVCMVIYLRRLQEKDPIKRLSSQRDKARESIDNFLVQTQMDTVDLTAISNVVERYYQEKKSGYCTFSNRAFDVCMISLFGAGINMFISAQLKSDIGAMSISVFFCLIAIAVTPLACSAWELYDSRHKASLLNTRIMLRDLECYMTSKSFPSKETINKSNQLACQENSNGDDAGQE